MIKPAFLSSIVGRLLQSLHRLESHCAEDVCCLMGFFLDSGVACCGLSHHSMPHQNPERSPFKAADILALHNETQ